MFISNSFIRVVKGILIVLRRISQLVLLIYVLMHLLSKCHGPHALSLPFHHCCRRHYITTVIAIVLLWSLSLFPILYWQTQSHSHFPFDKSWPALQRLYTTLHFFYSFVKIPCDQNSDCFYANPLNRAITTVACFPMILWYICDIFGFFETFVFTTPISTYILQTSCFQSHVRDGFSLWAGVWQWFHSKG